MAEDTKLTRRGIRRTRQSAHLPDAKDVVAGLPAQACKVAPDPLLQRPKRASPIDPSESHVGLELMVDPRQALECVQALLERLLLVDLRQECVDERQATVGEGTKDQVAKVDVIKDHRVAWVQSPTCVGVHIASHHVGEGDACDRITSRVVGGEGLSERSHPLRCTSTMVALKKGRPALDFPPRHTLSADEGILLVLVELGHIDQRAGDAVRIADEWALGEWIPATPRGQRAPMSSPVHAKASPVNRRSLASADGRR